MAQISEGFDMESGKKLGREKNGATKILQYMGPQEKTDFGQLYAHNPHWWGPGVQTQRIPTFI